MAGVAGIEDVCATAIRKLARSVQFSRWTSDCRPGVVRCMQAARSNGTDLEGVQSSVDDGSADVARTGGWREDGVRMERGWRGDGDEWVWTGGRRAGRAPPTAWESPGSGSGNIPRARTA